MPSQKTYRQPPPSPLRQPQPPWQPQLIAKGKKPKPKQNHDPSLLATTIASSTTTHTPLWQP